MRLIRFLTSILTTFSSLSNCVITIRAYEYYQKDDRFSLHKYSLKDIDSTERRQFSSDTEWSLFEKMFFAYGLYEIRMHGSNHCIRFIWIIQDEEEEPTSLQYYYDVGNESDFFS